MGSPGAQIRGLLDSSSLVVAPGAFDPFTARIIESLGFPAVYLGGNAMGLHLGCGQPFLTLTETVDCTLRTARVVGSPLIVDADAGFGDAAHTYRTVKDLERAGAAAIHIDDQPAPKRAHYHLGKGRVGPVEEIEEKLRAAVSARQDPAFVLIGRTDARRTQSLADSIERCWAVVDAGADMLLVVDLPLEEAPEFREELPETPLIWIGGQRAPVPTISEIEAAGFAMAVYPFTTVAAITEAVTQTWQVVRDEGRPNHSPELLTDLRARVLELIGLPVYWEIERQTTEREDPEEPDR